MALKKGATGTDVTALQTKLKEYGFYKGAIDGSFGGMTDTALRAFQKAAGISIDGSYGPQSTQALLNYKAPTTYPVNTVPVVDPNAPVYKTLPVENPVAPPTTSPVIDPALGGYNIEDPTKPYNYDPAKDPQYQALAAEKNRQIGNAMNRRGIYGSTIMQEGVSSAQADLLRSSQDQAYARYNASVSDRQNKMDQALRNATVRGYYNNEEAALWGVNPGAKIGGYGSTGGPGKTTTGETSTSDTELQKINGIVKLTDTQKNWLTELKSAIVENPEAAVGWLDSLNLSDDLKAHLLGAVVIPAELKAEWGATMDGGAFKRAFTGTDKGVFPNLFGNRMWAVYSLWNNPLLTQTQKASILNQYPGALELLNTVLDVSESSPNILKTPLEFLSYIKGVNPTSTANPSRPPSYTDIGA